MSAKTPRWTKADMLSQPQVALLPEFVNFARCGMEADQRRKRPQFSPSDHLHLHRIATRLERAYERWTGEKLYD